MPVPNVPPFKQYRDPDNTSDDSEVAKYITGLRGPETGHRPSLGRDSDSASTESVIGRAAPLEGVPLDAPKEVYTKLAKDALRFDGIYLLAMVHGEEKKLRITPTMTGDGSGIIRLVETLRRQSFIGSYRRIRELVMNKIWTCEELGTDLKTVTFMRGGDHGKITSISGQGDGPSLQHWKEVLENYKACLKEYQQDQEARIYEQDRYDKQILAGWYPSFPSDFDANRLQEYEFERRKYEARRRYLTERGQDGARQVQHISDRSDSKTVVAETSRSRSLPRFESTLFSTKKEVGSVFDWLRMYERLCGAQDIVDDLQRINWLSKALDPTDSTLWKWYHGLSRHQLATWNDVRHSFILHFVPHTERTPTEIWQRLSNSRKTAKETIRAFASSFEAGLEQLMEANAIAVEGYSPSTPQICRTWLKCVSDSSLAQAFSNSVDVYIDYPEFIAATIEWKEKHEAAFVIGPTVASSSSTSRNFPSRPSPVPPGQGGSRFSSSNRSNVGSTMPVQKPSGFKDPAPVSADSNSRVDQLTAKLKDLQIKLGQQAGPYNGQQSSSPGSRSCYRCGQSGHLLRACPASREQVLPTWRGFLLHCSLEDLADEHEAYDPNQEDYYEEVRVWQLECRIWDLQYGEESVGQDFPEGY